MRPDGPLIAAGHSRDFVAAWGAVYCEVYRWRREDRFAVVPSLLGAPTFAYMPGLNYTDLDAGEAQRLAREMTGKPFNIRALAPPSGMPPAGAPVTLRLDLRAFGHDGENVWRRALGASARRNVRRAQKAGLRVSDGTDPAAIASFHGLLSATLGRHGAPMMPKRLFEALIGTLDARVLLVRDPAGGEVLAGLVRVRDGALVWTPWVGSRPRASLPGSGELLYWTLIASALDAGAAIVDFGRSPAEDGAYRFKRKFGAVPVPILWLSHRAGGLHRRYAPAQKLWRAMPNAVTNALGPPLCRYLADY